MSEFLAALARAQSQNEAPASSKTASSSDSFLFVQYSFGPRQSLAIDDTFPTDWSLARRVGIFSNTVINPQLGSKLLANMKQLQQECTNYRLGSVLGRGEGVRIQDLIDPSRTCGSKLWIPCEYDVASKRFESPICDLSERRYGATLYPVISDIFRSMFPMFSWVMFQNEDMNLKSTDDEVAVQIGASAVQKLQVIVKMQDYQMDAPAPPHVHAEQTENKSESKQSKYEGKFHKEGVPEEHIVAVGIYYFDVDDTVSGGQLEIQTPVVTTCGGGKNMDSVQCPKENTFVSGKSAIVFSNENSTYHRVMQMSGYGSRKIIAFFLIDPSNRIKSSKDVLVNWDDVAWKVLNVWQRELNIEQNVADLKEIICRYAVKAESIREERTKQIIENRAKAEQDRVTALERTYGMMD